MMWIIYVVTGWDFTQKNKHMLRFHLQPFATLRDAYLVFVRAKWILKETSGPRFQTTCVIIKSKFGGLKTITNTRCCTPFQSSVHFSFASSQWRKPQALALAPGAPCKCAVRIPGVPGLHKGPIERCFLGDGHMRIHWNWRDPRFWFQKHICNNQYQTIHREREKQCI